MGLVEFVWVCRSLSASLSTIKREAEASLKLPFLSGYRVCKGDGFCQQLQGRAVVIRGGVGYGRAHGTFWSGLAFIHF